MAENQVISPCKVLLIGGSAGSLDVLLKVLPQLDAVSFAVVTVLHRKNAEDQTLEDLLAAKSKLPVATVEDKVPLISGSIYIAPSDYHLLFEKNHVLSLDVSEKINHSRPSIDVSFESAADVYGNALVAVLLSGANADGTAGLKAVKNSGGIAVVQNPESAEMAFMPQHAMSTLAVDHVLDVEQLIAFIQSINS